MQRSRFRSSVVVIVAVATLMVSTVSTAGAARAPRSPSGSGSSTTISDDTSHLLSYIPTDHRYVCQQFTPDETNTMPQVLSEAHGISAAVQCFDETIPTITYYQFEDGDTLGRAYLTVVAQFETGAEDTDCPANGTWGFGDDVDGRILCYPGTQRGGQAIAPTATRLWTDDRTNIMGIASLPEGDDDFSALRTWWQDEAGPLKDPDDSGFVEEPDADDVDDLLASIPKQTRKSCEETDRGTALAYVGEQIVVEAAVVCMDVAKGIEEVYYYAIDPDVIEDVIASLARSVSQEELDDTDEDEICPAVGSWTTGKGKAKREVGSYSCYFADTPDGELTLWNWTDAEQGIMGSAESSDDDPARVRAWWRSSASGPLES